DVRANAPFSTIIRRRRCARESGHERKTESIRRDGPWCPMAVAQRENRRAQSRAEGERLTVVIQMPAADKAVTLYVWILRGKRVRVSRQDKELPRAEQSIIGEGESEAVGETHAGHIERVRAGVFEFNKLEGGAVRFRKMIHDFRQRQRAEIL